MNAINENKQTTMIRLKQVLELTGLSRSTVYELMNVNSPRYDSSFPTSVRLTASTAAWVSAEIDAWIQSKITQSRRR